MASTDAREVGSALHDYSFIHEYEYEYSLSILIHTMNTEH
jgi:hypothetical protein